MLVTLVKDLFSQVSLMEHFKLLLFKTNIVN